MTSQGGGRCLWTVTAGLLVSTVLLFSTSVCARPPKSPPMGVYRMACCLLPVQSHRLCLTFPRKGMTLLFSSRVQILNQLLIAGGTCPLPIPNDTCTCSLCNPTWIVSFPPPLGWRSWNYFEERVSQDLLQQQIDGLTRRRHGNLSLWDLGYSSIGLDDGWQLCGPHGYHDANGDPVVNLTRFPNMSAMTAYARGKNVSMVRRHRCHEPT